MKKSDVNIADRICFYCKNQCAEETENPDRFWFYCNDCKCTFRFNWNSPHELMYLDFDRIIDNISYHLLMGFDPNITQLTFDPNNYQWDPNVDILLVELLYHLDIDPALLEEKIKFLLPTP